MMGRTHVLTGMSAGAAILPIVPVSGTGSQLAWVAVVAGSAILPDLDHRQATVTRMWGPISYVMHVAVSWAGRGHRGGAHDPLIAPLAFGLLAWLAALHPIGAGIMVAIAAGLAVRACEFVIPCRTAESAIVNIALSASAGCLAVMHAVTFGWLPFAVGLGVLVHIAGDAVTRSGVPKPLSWLDGDPDRNQGPLTTGRWYENWLIAPALVAATAVLVYLNVPTITLLIQEGLTHIHNAGGGTAE
jgi:membrane-bound metal-dependent hydrolase YbcI (DUF457 family)